MKKVITYVVMLAYLTVALRPAQAQPQLAASGQEAEAAPAPELPKIYNILVYANPADGGTVSRKPNYSAYYAGTQVTLKAAPSAGYTFAGWNGVAAPASASSNIIITVKKDLTLTANFRLLPPPSPPPPPPPPATVYGKPKVAVYVSESTGYSEDEKSALRTGALNTLVRSGRYQVIERSNVIDAELMIQAGGAIDDDQLTAFGKQLGAQFVCIADMTYLRDRYVPKYCRDTTGRIVGPKYECGNEHLRDHQVSVRLIDVETAEVLAFGLVEEDIKSGVAITGAVANAVNKMLGTIQAVKAPNLPKMAVYVTGGSRDDRVGNAFYSYTLEALFTRSKKLGNFKVIERSEAFTRQIDREQTTQRSGHVDDNQIARLGKQYGIQNILLANIDKPMSAYNISGRIINIESASVDNASVIYHTNNDLDGLNKISASIVEEMMGLTSAEVTERAEAKAKEEADAKRKETMKTLLLVGAAVATLVYVAIMFNKNKDKVETVSVGGAPHP